MRAHLAVVVVGALTGVLTSGADSTAFAQTAVSEPDYRVEAGLGLRFMPIGWFDLSDAGNQTGFRAYPALGIAPFLQYEIDRYIGIGFSPELTLNVIPNRSDYHVGEMLAGVVRMEARYPNRTRFQPYAVATGGYSVIWRANANSAKGFVVEAGIGSRLVLASRHALFIEIDYQKGFQTVDGGDYGPSYFVIGSGWQIGL